MLEGLPCPNSQPNCRRLLLIKPPPRCILRTLPFQGRDSELRLNLVTRRGLHLTELAFSLYPVIELLGLEELAPLLSVCLGELIVLASHRFTLFPKV